MASIPTINCPKCQTVVATLGSARTLYHIARRAMNGRTAVMDVPACPIAAFAYESFAYVLDPCGCEVSMAWAAAFTREVNSRRNGNPPRPVIGWTAAERDVRLIHLTEALTKLYIAQTKAKTIEAKEAADYWVAITADQIQRLSDEPLQIVPARPIVEHVQRWLRDVNSKVNVLSPSPMDVLTDIFDSQPTIASRPPLASLYSQGRPQREPDKYITPAGKLSHTPTFPGQLPARTETKVQGDVLPTVAVKSNGQWSVRFNDVYKVFVTEEEAINCALLLVQQAGVNLTLVEHEGKITAQANSTPTPLPEPADPLSRKKRTIRQIKDD